MRLRELTNNNMPDMAQVLTALKKKLKDEGGAAGFDPLKAVAKKMDVNLTPAMLKGMSGIKMHRDGDYILEEVTPGQGMPKQIDVTKMPTPPQAPTGPDGKDENGTRIGTTPKGNRSVSNGGGTYIFTPKGQLMLYMTPKMGGLQQTHNIAKQTVTVNFDTAVDNVGIGQKATYDMSGKLISGDNTSVSSGPFSASMDKDKGTSMSYDKGNNTSYNINSKDSKVDDKGNYKGTNVKPTAQQLARMKSPSKKALSRMQSNLNKGMSISDPYKGIQERLSEAEQSVDDPMSADSQANDRFTTDPTNAAFFIMLQAFETGALGKGLDLMMNKFDTAAAIYSKMTDEEAVASGGEAGMQKSWIEYIEMRKDQPKGKNHYADLEKAQFEKAKKENPKIWKQYQTWKAAGGKIPRGQEWTAIADKFKVSADEFAAADAAEANAKKSKSNITNSSSYDPSIQEKFMSFDTDTTTKRNTTTNKYGTFTSGSTTDNKANPFGGDMAAMKRSSAKKDNPFGGDMAAMKRSSTKKDNPFGGEGGTKPTAMLTAGPPYRKEDVPKVKQIQTAIQDLGYNIGSSGVDGKYGPRTARAVQAFKADYAVPGDAETFGNSATATLSSVVKGTTPKIEPEKQTKIDTSYSGGGEVGPMQNYDGPSGETSGKIGDLLDMISKPESGGRYDMVYPGRRRPQILDMTIAELIVDMKARAKSGSSASGRYQYIRKTLQGVTRSMGMDINTTKFDPKTQDEIVIYHLRKDHGLDSWLSGKTSDENFLRRLSKTWAGLPDPKTGKSYYAGDGMNKSGVGAQASLNTLQTIRTA
jgi:peptidoglycan hydrolase-like protein with peptidoglycan-binding domain